MQQSMTGTGVELKILFMGIKYISICLFVWFIEPIFGFIVLQIDSVALLSTYMKSFLDDIKIILGVLITLLLAVKYMYEILTIKRGSTKQ